MTNVNDARSWQGLPGLHADSRAHLERTLGAPADVERFRGVFKQRASAELARRAAANEGIMVLANTVDADFLHPWRDMSDRVLRLDSGVPQGLQWCAAFALEGGHPYAFLSLQELQSGFAQLRQEICLKRARVTLIVEPHAKSHDDEVVSAAGLAGIRQLPHLALLSPKDATELEQMIGWCGTHGGPVLIWLPSVSEAPIQWNAGPNVELARAEQLSAGGHVTIIAWGPMVGAAWMAAQCMAQDGVEATVINARFAQPLDRETIVRAAQGSLCTILVDDADDHGGFSSWVLDHLMRVGVTQPVTVVAPGGRSLQQNPHDALGRCALSIVEHCRWLAEPVRGSGGAPDESIVPVAPGGAPSARVWANPPSAAVFDEYDDQRQVLAQQFSPFIEQWVAEYAAVGGRDLYLWRWCLHGLNLTTLPCVAPELRAHVRDTKLLSIILCVLLDDVADQHGGGGLLSAMVQMACCGVGPTWQSLSPAEKRHGEVAQAVWTEYWARASAYPCYAAFEPVLRYDLLQFFNTMRYSHLVNSRPYLLNMAEHDVYTPHNMMMISFATLDLMCSPGFPQAEVGPLREAAWHAQCMGRIGNLLSTWRRELADRDFTSGVFARALVEGDLTLDELKGGEPARLESVIRRGNHEAYFLRQWLEHRRRCHALARRIQWVDLEPVLDGHDRFFAMHLGSQGLI